MEASLEPLLSTLRARLEAGDAFSLGGRGALAEYQTLPDDAPRYSHPPGGVCVATARGALCVRLTPGARTLARPRGRHGHDVVVTLPAAAAEMAGRSALTELGPDRDAVLPEHRDHLCFDLGLGIAHVDARLRTADPRLVALLRGCLGRPLLDLGPGPIEAIKAFNPHRVFVSRLARIEVFAPIPAPREPSPAGPHTHLDLSRLRARLPAATPARVGCLTVHSRVSGRAPRPDVESTGPGKVSDHGQI